MSSFFEKLKRFRAGESLANQLRARRLNLILDVIERNQLVPGRGYRIQKTNSGTVLTIEGGEGRGTARPSALQLTRTVPAGYASEVQPTDYFISWGTVNGVEPDNINDPFTVAESTVWVFMECDLQGDPGQSANLVTACRIVTGASSTAHVTPGFGSDGSLPANAYISLGRVQVTGDQKSIINSGNGSIMLAAHITNLTCITGGGPRISRQLSHWRLNP